MSKCPSAAWLASAREHQPVPKPTAAALAGETEVQVGETECKSHSWSHILILSCEEDLDPIF